MPLTRNIFTQDTSSTPLDNGPSKKIGFDHTIGSNFTVGANDFHAARQICIADGLITRMTVFLANQTVGKKYILGIYADSGGLPGVKLAQTVEGTTITNEGGIKTLLLQTPIYLTKGTTYWLVLHSDSALIVEQAFNSAASGGQKYRTVTYSSTLPDPFGGSLLDAGGYVPVAAW